MSLGRNPREPQAFCSRPHRSKATNVGSTRAWKLTSEAFRGRRCGIAIAALRARPLLSGSIRRLVEGGSGGGVNTAEVSPFGVDLECLGGDFVLVFAAATSDHAGGPNIVYVKNFTVW